MGAKKHRLTKKIDHTDGFKGQDLFLAPAKHDRPTLSNKDHLDGRGGIDTISAFLKADTLTPRLANIETGIFTRTSKHDLILDLARAKAMRSVTMTSFDADAIINHAARLSSLTIVKSQDDIFTVHDLDTVKIALEKLNLNNAKDITVDLQGRTGTAFTAMDVTLADSTVKLKGEVGSNEITIHARGNANALEIAPDATTAGIHGLKIDGAGNLDLAPNGAQFLALTSFNAATATGNIKATLGGAGLTKVSGSAGDDTLTIKTLGGTAMAKAEITLGKGNDAIDLTAVPLSADLHMIDGGEGMDSLAITGQLVNAITLFKNFETLKVVSGIGSYDLTGAGVVNLLIDAVPGSTMLEVNGMIAGSALALTVTDTTSNVMDGVFDLNGDIGAQDLTVHAKGTLNQLNITSDMATAAIKNIVIDGEAGLLLGGNAGHFANLVSFDASQSTGITSATLGGANLMAVLGGRDNDALVLTALAASAKVNLGDGNDFVSFADSVLQAGTQSLDGGTGADIIAVQGALANFGGVFSNFEELRISNGGGAYDLNASGILTGLVDATGAAAGISLTKADKISAFTLNNAGAHAYAISGVDTAQVALEKISFNGNTDTTLDLQTLNHINLAALELKLNQSRVSLTGDVGAANVTVHSNGLSANILNIDPNATSTINNLVIDGMTNLKLDGNGIAFTSLTGFDASQATGKIEVKIGGANLASVKGSSGIDELSVTSLGNTAVVDLATGDDSLYFAQGTGPGAGQVLDGGEGNDYIRLYGGLTNANQVLNNFEKLVIGDAAGVYDLTGVGLKDVEVHNPTSAVTLNGLASDCLVNLNDDTPFATTINIENAVGAITDVLQLDLYTGAFGLATAGLNSAGLSTLKLTSRGNGADTLYFETLGAANDKTTIDIHGDQGLTLKAVTGSTSHIGKVNVHNDQNLTLGDLTSNCEVNFNVARTLGANVTIKDAVGQVDDVLNLGLSGGQYGTNTAGLSSTGLSTLNINSTGSGQNILYLGNIGGPGNDDTTINITGDKSLALKAVTGSTSHISKITITGNAGVDIVSLSDSVSGLPPKFTNALVSTGVEIFGGDGDDKLVGGAGNDIISSGAGDNIVHSSKGGDVITLKSNSGANSFIIDTMAEGIKPSFDTIMNFEINDAINIHALAGSAQFANVIFTGTFTTNSGGVNSLMFGETHAFFNTTTDMLIIDINKDSTMNIVDDIFIKLEGVETFYDFQLIF